MIILSQADKKKLKAIHIKKGRRKEMKFATEGVMLLEESLRHNYKPAKIYYSNSLMNDRAQKILRGFQKRGVETESISAREMKQISGTISSQGILALYDICKFDPDKEIKDTSKILLLDNISDPGNAGTLFRSALAFGIELILITNETVEPYNSKVVRSSAGAIFGLPIIEMSLEDILHYRKKCHLLLIAADSRGVRIEDGLKKMRKNTGFILAIGSEALGLSSGISESSDLMIRINHRREVESLNAAVAGSIIMKEIYYKILGN